MASHKGKRFSSPQEERKGKSIRRKIKNEDNTHVGPDQSYTPGLFTAFLLFTYNVAVLVILCFRGKSQLT